MKRRIVLFLLILILFFSPASAAELNRDKALSWLNEKIIGNEAIQEVALSILALQGSNYNSKTQSLISQLESQMSVDGCFPKDNCNVKDTAFALLALSSFERPTEKIVDWLENAKKAGTLTADWYIQVKTIVSGECKFSYEGLKEPLTISIEGNQNTGCGSPWISIGANNCINLKLSGEKAKDIEVDCSSLEDPSTVISLLRTSDNEIFIMQQENQNIATLTMDNSCWGKILGEKCDLDSTVYAYWALSAAEDITTPAFLKTSINKNAIHYSILYSKEKKVEYSNWLIQNQNEKGYWGNEETYNTAFGLKAGIEGTTEKALSWSASKQGNDGSWNNNILDTATMVYSTSTSVGAGSAGYCGDSFVQEYLGEECDGEDSKACPGKCILPGEINECTCEEAITCETNDDCSFGYYCNKQNGECVECLNDGHCNEDEECDLKTNICVQKVSQPSVYCDYDGVCESKEGEDEATCPDDCKGGFPFWIIWILVLLILILGGYYGYGKFFKKKPTEVKPSYLKKEVKPIVKPSTVSYKPSVRKPYEEYLERELDKSVKEAQKLLKRK